MKTLKILFPLQLILVVILLANIDGFPQQTAQYKLGIQSGNSLMSNKEQFEFTLDGNQKVVLDSTNPTVYFSKLFASGQNYRIAQTSGPRPCNFLDGATGTFANGDIAVMVNCGFPPLTILKLAIIGIESGEIFRFSDNYRRTMQTSFSTTASLGGFPQGDDYSITQMSGPRPCKMTLNQGVVPNSTLTITADCSRSGGGNSNPPTSIFKLNVIGVEAGESFSFADNYNRTFSTPFSTLASLGGFPIGANYSITQTGGPRQCKMSNNQGVVPNTTLIIEADCRKAIEPPAPPRAFPEIELVSRSTDDKSLGTFYSASAPVIGGKGADEGRYVAFVSDAAGLGGSKGKYRQIFWRDRVTGETKMISVTSAGEGNNNSFAPAISADGKSVAFESYATNLVPIDTNNVRDVFVWNYDSNRVTAVSDAPGGIEANAEAFEPAISGDGRLIVFTSSASTLTPGVEGTSTVNLFLKDMQTGTVTLISRDPKTGKGGGGSRGSISDDGSRIAFYNYFPLTADDKNNLWDIYVWERGNPKLKRISLTSEKGERDQGSESSSRVVSPTISGNGQFVTFATTAKNMVSGDTNSVQDVFVNEIDTGRVTRLSVGRDGQEPDSDTPIGQGEKISISQDGSWVVFSTTAKNLGGNILLKNVQTGEAKVLSSSQGVTVGRPDISPNGMYVVFGTSERLDARFQSSGIFVKYTGRR